MALVLQNLNAGDTDYIAKLNANAAAIAAAINQLTTVLGVGTPASADASPGNYLSAFFGGVTTLIGVGSYGITYTTNVLTVAAGAVFRRDTQTGVSSAVSTSINFIGKAFGTWYVSIDAIGTPQVSQTTSFNDIYSVVYNSSIGFNSLTIATTLLAKIAYTASVEDAARISTANSASYTSLDARLEAIETFANSLNSLKMALTYLSTSGTLAENSDV